MAQLWYSDAFLDAAVSSRDKVKIELKALRKQHKWSGGILPSGDWIADQAGQRKLYDYLHAATSRALHFSAGEIMRRGWGHPAGKMITDKPEFREHLASFALDQLWRLYVETWRVTAPGFGLAHELREQGTQAVMEEEMAAADENSQHGTSSLGEPLPLASGLRWRRVFPGEGSQLGVLRRWLESLLPDGPERDDVTLVATELGTNALVHTASGRGGWFAVEISWHRVVVRVAVADCGAPGGPRMIDDPAGEHGRGLLVVRSLSGRTGVCGDRRGRLVWGRCPLG